MDKNSEVVELRNVYSEMDVEGKKTMITTATQLFTVQKIFEKKSNQETSTFNPKYQTSRFDGVAGYFIMGFLLLFAAHFFWVTLISPVLFTFEITPLVMIRIILTASIGMFCIGVGLVRFMLQKLTIPFLLLALGAGLGLIDPGIVTDLIGFALITLVVSAQVIQGKRQKATMAI